MELSGKNAVITGASGGIGDAIALELWRNGCNLVLSGRTNHFDEHLIDQRSNPDQYFYYYRADLTEEVNVLQFEKEINKYFDCVDILIHSAGAFMVGMINETPVSELDRMYQVNIRMPYQITRMLLPLIKTSQGQIVFINSSAVFNPKAGIGKYAASKSALRAFANSLREEVNANGVRILSVFPGRTASKMQEHLHSIENKHYASEKLLQPEDVAAAVVSALKMPKTAEITDIHIRPFQKN